MPKTAAATRTELDAIPARTVAGTNGSTVHVDLIFSNGKAYDPVDIHDALIAKYGAGKVFTDKDSQGLHGGTLQFRIIP